MAFQFPDPSVATTVVNPETGITYQWQVDPGKWVIAVKDETPTYCVDYSSTNFTSNGSERLFSAAFQITGDNVDLYDFQETIEFHVRYSGQDTINVLDLDPAEQARIGFIEIRDDQYVCALDAGDSSIASSVEVEQVVVLRDINNGEYRCASVYRTPFIGGPPPGNNGIWIHSSQCCFDFYALGKALYVRKEGGDTMEGPLEITGGRNPDALGLVSTLKALNIDSGENSSLHLKYNGNTKVYVGDDLLTATENVKFNKNDLKIKSNTDTDLFTLNSSGALYEGAYTDDKHVATKKDIEDAIDALKLGVTDDYYNGLTFVLPTPAIDQMPLINTEQTNPWTGGGTVGELMFDINGSGDPYHIAFKAPIDLSSYDENLAVKFTHDSGVMYGRIASRWHNGGVHINLKDVAGDFIVDGEQTTKIEVQENIFVKREGDSMTGNLLMQEAGIQLTAGSITFQPIDDSANAGTDTDERWTNIISRRVRDENGAVITGSNAFGIRIDLTEGRTGYNKLELFANVDGSTTGDKFMDFGGGNNPAVRFHRGNFQMEGNRIQKLGNAEVDTDAVPYGQVKDELKEFKSEIIEQAAVGIFRWDTQSSNTTPVSGCFFGKQDANNATEPFINNFRVSNEDINGDNQDFSTWNVGDIITWTNTINSAYQIRYRVNSIPTFQNGHYYFEVSYISQTNLFVQGNEFILTRQQFTNIDFGDLETTYLRLDCDNSPLVSSDGLEIKTDSERGGGFGEASLILNGKRDNKNNSVASIKFKNWHYDDSDTVNGYITYRTVGTADGYFRFNKDIDLLSKDVFNVSNLKLTNPGSIWSDTNERIKFKTATAGENGDGLVEFTRPGTNSRRGFAIRGKDTSNADNDIFYTYTNSSGGDAINYLGKQTDNSSNLATTKYVKNYVDNNVTSGATNITISRNSTSATVQSSSGTNGTINSASSSYAGVMTSSDKSKLDGMSYKIVYRSGNYFIESA